MFAHERRRKILDVLTRHRSIQVRALEQMLRISPATLRRDLAFLEQNDRLVRVHGGAVHPDERDEPSFHQKSALALDAKRRIASAVADSIPKDATVFIDSGTTCLEAGLLLRARRDLTILTNSIPLAAGYEQFRAKLLVLGGEVRHVSGAMVGDLSSTQSSQLRADVALIGTSGLHPMEGAGTTELLERTAKRNWLLRSTRKCLLADATKWEVNAAVHFACWTEFDDFFTDLPPPKKLRKSLKIIIA